MAQTKTAKMVGLFVAAAMTISGCSSDDYDDDCYDTNNDGYCDENGSSGGGYIYTGGKKYSSNSSGVSKGSSGYSSSSSKGGIGSSGISSSG
jgi:hypothetical protein